jgi:hypothetical protein
MLRENIKSTIPRLPSALYRFIDLNFQGFGGDVLLQHFGKRLVIDR